jgi:hypothetical protein
MLFPDFDKGPPGSESESDDDSCWVISNAIFANNKTMPVLLGGDDIEKVILIGIYPVLPSFTRVTFP